MQTQQDEVRNAGQVNYEHQAQGGLAPEEPGEDWAEEEIEFKQLKFENLVAGETMTIETFTDPSSNPGTITSAKMHCLPQTVGGGLSGTCYGRCMQLSSVPSRPGNTHGNPTLTGSSQSYTGEPSQKEVGKGNTRSHAQKGGNASAGISISQKDVPRTHHTQSGWEQAPWQPKGWSTTVAQHA